MVVKTVDRDSRFIRNSPLGVFAYWNCHHALAL
jgi:hypothetical protein